MTTNTLFDVQPTTIDRDHAMVYEVICGGPNGKAQDIVRVANGHGVAPATLRAAVVEWVHYHVAGSVVPGVLASLGIEGAHHAR